MKFFEVSLQIFSWSLLWHPPSNLIESFYPENYYYFPLSGIVPSALKSSIIISDLKLLSPDPGILANYRPVAKLYREGLASSGSLSSA